MIVLVRPPLAHHHGNTPNNSMEMGTCTQCSVTTAILHLTLATDQSYSLHWETSGHIDSPVMLSVDPALNANQVVQRMRTPSAALSTFSPPPPGGYIQSRKPRNVQQRRKKPLRWRVGNSPMITSLHTLITHTHKPFLLDLIRAFLNILGSLISLMWVNRDVTIQQTSNQPMHPPHITHYHTSHTTTHHTSPHITHHHTSHTTTHHTPPHIIHHHTSYTTTHHALPHITHYHTSHTTTHHTPPHITLPHITHHHTSYTTTHHTPPHITHHHTSHTTTHHTLQHITHHHTSYTTTHHTPPHITLPHITHYHTSHTTTHHTPPHIIHYHTSHTTTHHTPPHIIHHHTSHTTTHHTPPHIIHYHTSYTTTHHTLPHITHYHTSHYHTSYTHSTPTNVQMGQHQWHLPLPAAAPFCHCSTCHRQP